MKKHIEIFYTSNKTFIAQQMLGNASFEIITSTKSIPARFITKTSVESQRNTGSYNIYNLRQLEVSQNCNSLEMARHTFDISLLNCRDFSKNLRIKK